MPIWKGQKWNELFQEIWQNIWIIEYGRTQRDHKDHKLYEALQIQKVHHGWGEKTDILQVGQFHLFTLGRVQEHWGQNGGANLSSLFVGGGIWRHPRPFLGLLLHDPVGQNPPPRNKKLNSFNFIVFALHLRFHVIWICLWLLQNTIEWFRTLDL